MVIPAVSLASIALAIHIAAVVVAFGPLFAYPVPALPITLIAGLYLAAEEHALGKPWVVVPMVMIVMLMALHRLVLISGYKRLADRAGQPNGAGNDDVLARRVTWAQLVSAAQVVFTIFVMAAKPFS